jgi:hypothetical protein
MALHVYSSRALARATAGAFPSAATTSSSAAASVAQRIGQPSVMDELLCGLLLNRVNLMLDEPADGAGTDRADEPFDRFPERSEGRRKTQFFDIMASRGIYHDGWFASARGPREPWVGGMPPGIPPKGGSHYKIVRPGHPVILTIPYKRPIKPVYIRALVRLIDGGK